MKKILLVLSFSLLYLGALAQQLVRFEYWFDRDSEHRVAVDTENGDINLSINVKALHLGIHTLTFRALDTKGCWSSPQTTFFLRLQANGESSRQTCEYWFDNDTEQRMSATAIDGMLSLSVNANSLKVGIHSYHFRIKDDLGRWSVPVTSYFMRVRNALDGNNIIAYEYWIDEHTDKKVSGSSNNSLIALQVDAQNLAAGLHCLSFRTCDNSGNLSSPITQYFVKPYANLHNLVSGYKYWYNGHVEDIQLVRLSEPSSPLLLEVDLPTNNLEQEVTRENITMLSTDDGQQMLAIKNVLNMQFVDQRGKWSEVIADTFATAVGDRVISLTSFIKNPEANDQWNGWATQGNRSLATDGHWSGKNNNHFRLGNGKGSEMRQTVSGLPAGTYMLSAYGKSSAAGQFTMSVAGYVTEFPAVGDENGWSLRTVTFVTDGEPFDIVVSATGLPQGQWACIDGFELSVNGIVDKAGTLSLGEVQIASIANLSTWNSPGSAVRLKFEGQYINKKNREATIYYSVDNGSPIRLADAVVPGTKFSKEVECFFRENASPHIISFYGKDTEGMMSERKTIEIGNIVRGCTVENLPQQVIYTGESIEIDNLALRDNRTGKLLNEGEDYTILYHNNVDDGQATIIVEGVYPRYMGSRELHFVIKSYIAAEELAVLRTLYEQTLGDSLWHRKWNVQKEQVLCDELTGITARNRHVTAVRLAGNNLTGELPASLLALPALQTVQLENNHLKGIVNTKGIAASVKELYLANNHLWGLTGVIPATVEKLSLSGQTIDEVGTFHLSASDMEQQMQQLPNIGLYDHQQQNFSRNATITIRENSYNDPTLATLRRTDGQWLLSTDEWNCREYRKASGDTIYCRDDAQNRFKAQLVYDAGDANFDGLVNVQDLSALILYCLKDYNATFNYGAANLWQDETINVQDAVCLVNVLLDGALPQTPEQPAGARAMGYASEHTAQHSMLSIEDGRLLLASPLPVSAFDVVLERVRLQDVSSLIEPQGFVVSMKQQSGNLHLVGYSPVGGLLPVGETALVRMNSEHAKVKAALLADQKAKAIEVICADALGVKEVSGGELNVTMRKDAIIVTSNHLVNNVAWTLLTVGGAVIDGGHISSLPSGVSTLPCRMPQGGIYILRLTADGHQPTVRKINMR